jgi:hypothetical protein
VAHENANDFMTRLAQQMRGDTAVDTAGHR